MESKIGNSMPWGFWTSNLISECSTIFLKNFMKFYATLFIDVLQSSLLLNKTLNMQKSCSLPCQQQS
jgi:hypothetical protein